MSPDTRADEAAIRRWHQEVEDAVNNEDYYLKFKFEKKKRIKLVETSKSTLAYNFFY